MIESLFKLFFSMLTSFAAEGGALDREQAQKVSEFFETSVETTERESLETETDSFVLRGLKNTIKHLENSYKLMHGCFEKTLFEKGELEAENSRLVQENSSLERENTNFKRRIELLEREIDAAREMHEQDIAASHERSQQQFDEVNEIPQTPEKLYEKTMYYLGQLKAFMDSSIKLPCDLGQTVHTTVRELVIEYFEFNIFSHIDKLEEKIEELESQNEVLSRDLRRQDDDNEDLESEKDCLETQVDDLTSENSKLVQENSKLVQENSKLVQENSRLQRDLQEADKTNTTLSEMFNGLVSTIKSKFPQKREDPCKQLQEEIRNAMEDVVVIEELESEEDDLEELRVLYYNLGEKYDSLRDENSRLVQENDGLQKENSRLVQENDGLQKENSRRVQENSRLVQENSRLVQENSRLVQENTNLKKELEETGDDLGHVQQMYNKLYQENVGLHNENSNIHDKLDKLNRRECHQQRLDKKIRDLKNSNADLENRLSQEKYHHTNCKAALEGEMARTSGLRDELENLRTGLDAYKQECDELRKGNQGLAEENTGLQKQVYDLRKDYENALSTTRTLHQALAQERKTSKVYAEEIAVLRRENGLSNAEIHDLRILSDSLLKETEQLQRQLQDADEENEACHEKKDAAVAEKRSLQKRLQQISEELQRTKDENAKLRSLFEQVSRARDSLTKQVQHMSKRLKAMEDVVVIDDLEVEEKSLSRDVSSSGGQYDLRLSSDTLQRSGRCLYVTSIEVPTADELSEMSPKDVVEKFLEVLASIENVGTFKLFVENFLVPLILKKKGYRLEKETVVYLLRKICEKVVEIQLADPENRKYLAFQFPWMTPSEKLLQIVLTPFPGEGEIKPSWHATLFVYEDRLWENARRRWSSHLPTEIDWDKYLTDDHC